MASESSPQDLRCRFCLAEEVNELIPVFCVTSTQNMLISHMALACTGLAISSRDMLPQYICDECLGILDLAYTCWIKCRQSWGKYKTDSSINAEEEYRCRICLNDTVSELISLFCICDSQMLTVSEMLKRFAGLTISEKDEHPKYICDVCLAELSAGFTFRKLSRRSNETLRDQLNGKCMNLNNSHAILVEDDTLNHTSHDESDILVPTETLAENEIPIEKSTENELDPLETEDSSILESNDSSLQSSPKTQKEKIVSTYKSVTTTSTALQSPDKETLTIKKACFSNPEVCKTLDSHILNKSATRTTVVQPSKETATNLIPSVYYIASQNRRKFPNLTLISSNDTANKNSHFSRAVITNFYCQLCKRSYRPSNIKGICTKCKLPFDNYSNEWKTYTNQQGNIEAYCCKLCTFFAFTLKSLLIHLTTHQKNIPYSAVKQHTKNLKIVKKASKTSPPLNRTSPIEVDNASSKSEKDDRSTIVATRTCIYIPTTELAVVPETSESGQLSVIKSPRIASNQPPAKRQCLESSRTIKRLPRCTKVEYHASSSSKGNEITASNSASVSRNLLDTINISSDEEFTKISETDLEKSRPVVRISPGIDERYFDILYETKEYIIVILKGVICCGCLTVFETVKQRQIHLKRAHSENLHSQVILMCDICKTAISNTRHHRILGCKRIFYYCKLCPTMLINTDDYENHRLAQHKSKSLLTATGSVDILVWREGAESVLRNIENPTHCANPFKEVDNKFIFRTVKETSNYKLLFIKGQVCCGCQHWFSSDEALSVHCEEAHTQNLTLDDYMCGLCKSDCKSEPRLIRHRLQRSRKLYYYCKLCSNILIHHADDYQAHQAIAHQKLMPNHSLKNESMEMLIYKHK